MNYQDKIELYHDGEKTYYYDLDEKKLYVQLMNTMNYREKTRKFLKKSSELSLAVGILSIILNRWYGEVASLELNLSLLVFSCLVLIGLICWLSNFFTKQQSNPFSFVLVNMDEFDVENLIEQSGKLADSLRNLSIISLIIVMLGLPLFLINSLLIALVVAIFGALLFWGSLSYFDILKRYKAIDSLKENYFNVKRG